MNNRLFIVNDAHYIEVAKPAQLSALYFISKRGEYTAVFESHSTHKILLITSNEPVLVTLKDGRFVPYGRPESKRWINKRFETAKNSSVFEVANSIEDLLTFDAELDERCRRKTFELINKLFSN